MRRHLLSVSLLVGLVLALPAQAQTPAPFPTNSIEAKTAIQDGLNAAGTTVLSALESRAVLQRLAAVLGKRHSNVPDLAEIKRLLILMDPRPIWEVWDPDRAPLKLSEKERTAFARQLPRGFNPDLNAVTEQTWPANLSNGEKVALQAYSGTGAGAMNQALHTRGAVTPLYAQLHERIQSAFLKASPFAPPITVSRGIKLAPPQLTTFLDKLKAAQKDGKPYVMPGYASTTFGPKVHPTFDGNIHLHIKATHGLDLYPLSLYPEEREVLLNHNSTHWVKDVRQVGPRWIINLEQIPPK